MIDPVKLEASRLALREGHRRREGSVERLLSGLDDVDGLIARLTLVGEWVAADRVEEMLLGLARERGLSEQEVFARLDRLLDAAAS